MSLPHAEGEHWVAQEGAFSAATASAPVLHYFPARGRAEPIRLTLSLARCAWFEPPVEPLAAVCRSELDGYPFRQLPRYVEEHGVDVVQSMAILRHLGRKLGLYGSGLQEAAAVDSVLEAVVDLRAALKAVWCGEGLSPQAVGRYAASVLAPEAQLLASNTPGPGLACLERLLSGPHHRATRLAAGAAAAAGAEGTARREAAAHATAAAAAGAGGGSGVGSSSIADLEAADSIAAAEQGHRGQQDGQGGADRGLGGGGGSGSGDDDDAGADEGRLWFVGERISIADIAVADLVDMHLAAPQFEAPVKQNFPLLLLHRRRVMGQPGIKEYLASNNRHAHIWGVDWQRARAAGAVKS